MSKISHSRFHCSCGYVEETTVRIYPCLGQWFIDYLKFGAVYDMAQKHAIEFHNKRLGFSKLAFVKNQREQRRIAASKFRIEKNEDGTMRIKYGDEEETKQFLARLKAQSESERIKAAWNNQKTD